MNTVISKRRKQLINKLKLNIDKLNYSQLNEIIKGLIQGVDVDYYLDPSMTTKEMAECRHKLLNKDNLCDNNTLLSYEISKLFKEYEINDIYKFLSKKVVEHISNLILDKYNVSWIPHFIGELLLRNDQEIINVINNICKALRYCNININDDISSLLGVINFLRYNKYQLYELIDGYKHGLNIILYNDNNLEAFRMKYIKMVLFDNLRYRIFILEV